MASDPQQARPPTSSDAQGTTRRKRDPPRASRGPPASIQHTAVAAALLIQSAIALGAGVTIYLLLAKKVLLSLDSEEPQHLEGQESLLRTLWLAGNASLDPCFDFRRYVCSNYDPIRTPGALLSSTKEASLALRGLSRTEAGGLLFVYYRTCLAAQWKSTEAGRKAVEAVLQVVKASSAMSSLHLFSTILKLNLAYGLHGSIIVYQSGYGKLPQFLPRSTYNSFREALNSTGALLLVAARTVPYLEALSNPEIQKIISVARSELFGELSINVTDEELHTIAAEIQDTHHGECTQSHTSSLGSIVAGVSSRLWGDIVESCTGERLGDQLIHSPMNVLQRRFATLLDTKRQPVTTTLVILEAALSLAVPNVARFQNTTQGIYEFCEMSARGLSVLWALDDLLTFSAKVEHNQVIFQAFDSIIRTIVLEIERILEPKDVTTARRQLLGLHLVLPYHIVPLDMRLPVFSGNYFLNILYTRVFRMTSDRYRPPQGHYGMLKFFFLSFESVPTPGFIAIDSRLYTAATMDRTTDLLRNALFGFVIADRVWSVVFETAMSEVSRSALERYAKPVRREKPPRRVPLFIARPHLALRSCAAALRLDRWHELDLRWGVWRLSWSQAFYGIMVFHFFCEHLGVDSRTLQREVKDITDHNDDFLQAFRCRRPLEPALASTARI